MPRSHTSAFLTLTPCVPTNACLLTYHHELCGCPRRCADWEVHTCASCSLIMLWIYMTAMTTGRRQFVDLHVPFVCSGIPDRTCVYRPSHVLRPNLTKWPTQDPAGKTRRRRDRRKAPPARYEYVPNTTRLAPHILLDSDFSEYEEDRDLYDRLPDTRTSSPGRNRQTRSWWRSFQPRGRRSRCFNGCTASSRGSGDRPDAASHCCPGGGDVSTAASRPCSGVPVATARGRSPFLLCRRPARGCSPFLLCRQRARPYVPVQEVATVTLTLPSHVAVQEAATVPQLPHVPAQEEVELVMLPPPSHVPVQEVATVPQPPHAPVQEEVELVMLPPPSHVPVQEEVVLAPPSHVAVQEVAMVSPPSHVAVQEVAMVLPPSHIAVQEVAMVSPPSRVAVQEEVMVSPPSHVAVQEEAMVLPPSHVAVQEEAMVSSPSHVDVQEEAMVSPPSHVAVQEEAKVSPPSHVAVQEEAMGSPPSHVEVQEELGSSVEPPWSWRDFGMAVMALVLPSIILFAPDGSQPLHDLASLVTNPRLPTDQASVATNPWSSCNHGVGGSRPGQWPASFWFLLRRLVPHRGRRPESPLGDPGAWRPGRPPDLSTRTLCVWWPGWPSAGTDQRATFMLSKEQSLCPS
ncbi:uncharacterized protein LOC133501237 isoform X2 [Syngnathoides biaculeatus]|uniref:uncharacterized protein LOC133501237 isoform X2 n=1 Tax=Syngnathoides biaculeatus TaxID=300417 RepID=UPI002ADD3DA4|nr:uncharacterized protein LOC133501237 isoform X2 [Syngnathoides biaculeatus]